MCTKLVLNKSKYSSVTKCLKQLHWLPIEQGIQYKILVITHKSLKGNAPKYTQELIKEKQAPSRSLRSGSLGRLLHTPRILKETFASRSFSYAALALWILYQDAYRMKVPLPLLFNVSKHTYLKMHSTGKAREKVSLCILFTVLYKISLLLLLLLL